jgi:hypothetical protein
MAAVPSLLYDLTRRWNLITTGDLFWHAVHRLSCDSSGSGDRVTADTP